MRITAIETHRLDEHPDYLWVTVQTDVGLVGTGETMPRPASAEAVVHDVLAPMMIGEQVVPEMLWQRAFQAVSYHGYAGSEFRALSAVDIAIWDLLGQAAGLPIHRLLGGPCRETVPVYNTCVGYGDIDDRTKFLEDPVGLAGDLYSKGYEAMKIWPFDGLSIRNNGQRINSSGLEQGARPFEEIFHKFGSKIRVALEGHSCWGLPAAIEIARKLEPYNPLWLEDLIPAGNPQAWAELKRATSIPLCGSERLFGRYQLLPYLQAGALDIVKQDLCWMGGFTEFVKVAAMVATFDLPVAPHNCHGPIGAMATLHASAAIPNLYLMESVRSFQQGFFADLADGIPEVVDATLAVPTKPGLGTELRPEVLARANTRRTAESEFVVASGWTSGDPWAR